ncbi:MAG TPA: hypothetical protein VGM90_01175 [Kofleriaceae bacterium]|jgi:WD40 repeat protein
MKRWLAVSLIAGCNRQAAAPPPPDKGVAPPTIPVPVVSSTDIVRSQTKTTAGAPVIQIGQPRLQVAHPIDLQVRASANVAFVTDFDHVNIFELAHGTRIARLDFAPLACGNLGGDAWMHVAADGKRLIACGSVFEAPYASALAGVERQQDFAADSLRTYRSNDTGDGYDIFDVRQHTTTTWTVPAVPETGGYLDTVLDDKRLIWIGPLGAAFAENGANAWTTFATFATRWSRVEIASRATAAVGASGTASVYLDLHTGKTTDLPDRARAISPSGQRIALDDGSKMRIVDATGAKTASVPSAGMNITFADDNVVAYVADHQIRLYDLATGLRPIEHPSRFVQWTTDTSALVERAGVYQQLDTTSLALTPAAAATPPVRSIPPLWREDTYLEHTCELEQRVGDHTFKMSASQCSVEVGTAWDVAGGRVARVTEREIAVFDAQTERRVATIRVPPSQYRSAELQNRFWTATLSSDGNLLALWWRRPAQVIESGPILPHEPDTFACASFQRFFESCNSEYVAELWSLDGKPTRIWQESAGARKATSQIVFTHDGTSVVLGFDDGAIGLRATRAAGDIAFETLHRAPIARVELSPSDKFVFSEDAEGEQRVWPLPASAP